MTEADLARHPRADARRGRRAPAGASTRSTTARTSGGCDCRKPAHRLFERAARDARASTCARAAVVGDRASDMEAATAIGALRVLVRGFDEPMPPVDHVADDLLDGRAAGWRVRPLG